MAVNYQMDVINPFQAALQGYGAGAQMLQQERQVGQENQLFQAQMAETQAKAAKVQQETKNAELGQAAMADLFEAVKNKTVTPELVAKAYAVNKEVGTFGDQMLSNKTKEEKSASFGNLMRPLSALRMDQPDIAKADFEKQRDALLNSGNKIGADALQVFIDNLDTEDGRAFVEASLTVGALDAEPTTGDFKSAFENITAMQGAPLKATLAELDVDLKEAQVAREKAATRLDTKRAEMETTTGVEVQSSKIMDDGTTVMTMKDGTRKVLNPQGQLVEGDAAQQAIVQANKVGAELQGERAGARSGATLAQGVAKEAFVTLGNVRGNINNLDKVAALLDKPGVSTGVIESQLPTWDASTIELRNMRSRLGLDVVGSVTFGALSEGELNLALDVALPTNLSPQDLKKWVLSKKAAQEKLSNYLSEQVRFLSIPGNTVGDWEQHLINRSRMGAPAAGGVPDGAEFVRDASGKLVLKQ
jgi:hypothetical protein